MIERTTILVDALRAGDVIRMHEGPGTLIVTAIADPIGLLRLVDLSDGLTGEPVGRRTLRLDQSVERRDEPVGLHLLINRGDDTQAIDVAGRTREIDPGRFTSWFAIADVTVDHDDTWEHRVAPVAPERLARPGWETLRRATRPAATRREVAATA